MSRLRRINSAGMKIAQKYYIGQKINNFYNKHVEAFLLQRLFFIGTVFAK